MATSTLIPSGDFRTSYAADTTIFPTATSRNFAIAGIVLACFAPMLLSNYLLSIAIQIGIFAIAALGLNVLVGFTGQISIGHAAFFLFGAFTSAYISNNLPIPVFFAIPLAGVVTALVGLIFGVPAARLKGLYLVIATLAAQYILLDFFSRADWFSGGSVPASANPFSIFGYTLRGDRQYFYVVLAYMVLSYLLVTNLMRTRDGRALIAIRDHYLSAEIMGINLTKYRTLSFGLAAFFAGIAGGLAAINFEIANSAYLGATQSGLVLFSAFIGGTAYFFGPILGAILVTYLQLGLTSVTSVWQLYFGIIFIGIVMFAPGGIAGILMKHRPLIRAGTLGTVIPSYLVAAVPTLAFALGIILTIETVARFSGGDPINLLGIPFVATAPTTWVAAAVLLVGGFMVARITWKRVAEAWDRAATVARDRGYLA